MCSNRLQLDTRHFNLEKYLVIILCGQPGHQSHLPAMCRVQGVVCGHQLGFLLLQVESNKYVVLAVALRGDQWDQGRARGRVEEVDTNTK